jgi:hypothetical protein
MLGHIIISIETYLQVMMIANKNQVISLKYLQINIFFNKKLPQQINIRYYFINLHYIQEQQ